MKPIKVEFLKNSFFLNENSYHSLNSKGFGKYNDKKFTLNNFEILYLLEKNKIEVFSNSKKLNFNEILKKTKTNYDEFLVYKDLKSKGYLVNSGSKYGFLFRIYDKTKNNQDHAIWLLDVLKTTKKTTFLEILSKNRVAHSTRKKMLFAIIDEEKTIVYIENTWLKV